MWALNTCGEPTEIELTIRVLTTGSKKRRLRTYPAFGRRASRPKDDINFEGYFTVPSQAAWRAPA